jgi:O-acetylhomoserine (thiol)-lyase
MGIAESLIRVSVGIEETADLLADFGNALTG